MNAGLKSSVLKLHIVLFGSLLIPNALWSEDYASSKDSIQLERINVQASGNKIISPASYVLTHDDWEQKGYDDLIQVINTIPSMHIRSEGGVAVPDIRGQGFRAKDTVKIMVDGVALNGPINTPMEAQGSTELYAIPLEMIERIEVLPNSGAVLYGDSASGGLINIITRKDAADKIKFGLRSTFKKDFTNLGFNLTLPFKQSRLGLFYDYVDKKQTDFSDKEKTHSTFINFNSQLNQYVDIDLRYHNLESERFVQMGVGRIIDQESPSILPIFPPKIISSTYWKDAGDLPRINPHPIKYKKSKNDFFIGLNVSPTESTAYHLDISGFKSTENLRFHPSALLPLPDPTGTITARFNDYRLFISPHGELRYGENNIFHYGISYEDNKAVRYMTAKAEVMPLKRVAPLNQICNNLNLCVKINPTIKQHFNLSRKDYALFLQNQMNFGGFSVIGGYRYNRLDMRLWELSDVYFDSTFPQPIKNVMDQLLPFKHGQTYLYKEISRKQNLHTFNGALAYKWDNGVKLFATFNKGNTVPALNKYVNNEFAKGKIFILNEELQFESYNQYEMGLEYQDQNNGFKMILFQENRKNELSLIGKPPAYWEYFSVEKTRRKGVELSAFQNFGRFKITESFSYINPRIIDSKIKNDIGKTIPLVPKTKANIGLTYQFNDSLSGSLIANYQGKYRVSGEYAVGNMINYVTQGEVPKTYFESYSENEITFDLLLNYKYKNFNLKTGVLNLGNKKYADYSYQPVGDMLSGQKAKEIVYPKPKRSYYLSLGYQF